MKITGNTLDKSSQGNNLPTDSNLFTDDFKYSGVKKLQMLGIVENVVEDYDNVSKLFKACDFSKMDHEKVTFTGDQKMGMK